MRTNFIKTSVPGVLFGEQSVAGLTRAIRLAESHAFDPAALRAQAAPFTPERFDREFRAAFDQAYARWRSAGGAAGSESGTKGRRDGARARPGGATGAWSGAATERGFQRVIASRPTS